MSDEQIALIGGFVLGIGATCALLALTMNVFDLLWECAS